MAGFEVGICGAGVAGLAAAIALRRLGYEIEVSHLSTARCRNDMLAPA
jgi:2-polyprenyl-6-methoxyphenol hydroxylase-like FAD-dependent oxidoreductase